MTRKMPKKKNVKIHHIVHFNPQIEQDQKWRGWNLTQSKEPIRKLLPEM